MAKRYFGFRVDSTSTDKCNFFFEEIKQGRLRQGWGYEKGQNLLNQTVDKGAFFENDNKKVIDKIIIVTKSTYKDIRREDEKIMQQHKDVRLIFSDDLATILSRIALKYKTYNIN